MNTDLHGDLTSFLQLSYAELNKRNIELKKQALTGKSMKEMVLKAIQSEAGLKAVIACFSDLEGKLHLLDYNPTFFVESHDHLTFDGSSIRGFTAQKQSDLYLEPDFRSFRWLPADIFGPGKTLIFCNVRGQDGALYESDFRARLSQLTSDLSKKDMMAHVAPEIEGFLFEGENAEQVFNEKEGFALASKGGYFNALPQDKLRVFIDRLAEAIGAMGFENEKDHPEVAPSQFELNFKYTDILIACDQILLYKLTARQIAKSMGMTASFLPKPVAFINGSGMHTNISLNQDGKNLFYDAKGKHHLSQTAWDFSAALLFYGKELCLALNASVNAYRRLDPHYEAPNEIKLSSTDRGSMIRIPLATEKGARIEVRTVAPDVNPYLAYYLILKTGLEGVVADKKTKANFNAVYSKPVKKLPGIIQPAIEAFKRSKFVGEMMGRESHEKYVALKMAAAGRSPAALGNKVKNSEIHYHHEVTNQLLWKEF